MCPRAIASDVPPLAGPSPGGGATLAWSCPTLKQVPTEERVAEHVVVLKLNAQQLELLDRTIARGLAPDRPALIRRALREFAVRHAGERPAFDAGAPK